ncbi:MAG: 3-phosphoshikimate 1-carboxyvinyltransferase [Pirellulales bacterium]
MNEIEVRTSGPFAASIRPPGSKSITNRALVCAALAVGDSKLIGALDSEDTRVMVDSLQRLGLDVVQNVAAATIAVRGCGGRWPRGQADLFVGNSGTTIRFVTAMLASGEGVFRLDGVARMRERPIGDLLDALRGLGVDARSELGTGCPPVVIYARGLRGGTTRVRGDVSSQFLSGLLLAAPYCQSNLDILVDGVLVSQPYVAMTMQVMRAFGAECSAPDLTRFHIPGAQRYAGRVYEVEPDASAASYFWGAAAIAGGTVKVEGLTRDALQGDVHFVDCLQRMGCLVEHAPDGIAVTGGPLRGIDVDMNAISDTVQTLGAVALFADSPTTITGVAHIRHKETDRIGDLARELRKFGGQVDEFEDGLRIYPSPHAAPRSAPLAVAPIDTYNDHRMAMSLALPGLRIPGVVIRNPECTVKTYPRFFEDLNSLQRR